MAKKAVASLQSGSDKSMVKVIKMVKSQKTGSYNFKESIVHTDNVKAFLSQK